MIALSMLFVDEPVTRLLERRSERASGRAAEWWRRTAAVPRSVHTGLVFQAALEGSKPGMIGAFVGFGVKASLATLAVLGYRTISYWLPTVPGAIAYLRLRHTAGSDVQGGQ